MTPDLFSVLRSYGPLSRTLCAFKLWTPPSFDAVVDANRAHLQVDTIPHVACGQSQLTDVMMREMSGSDVNLTISQVEGEWFWCSLLDLVSILIENTFGVLLAHLLKLRRAQ